MFIGQPVLIDYRTPPQMSRCFASVRLLAYYRPDDIRVPAGYASCIKQRVTPGLRSELAASRWRAFGAVSCFL
jgi:hypothetical protein